MARGSARDRPRVPLPRPRLGGRSLALAARPRARGLASRDHRPVVDRQARDPGRPPRLGAGRPADPDHAFPWARPLRLHEDRATAGDAVEGLLRRRRLGDARGAWSAGRDDHAPHHGSRPRRAPRGRSRLPRPGAGHARRRLLRPLLRAGVFGLPRRGRHRRLGRTGEMKDVFRVRRMWRPRSELKDRYDVVIVGAGSHGLATAYYLVKNHGVKSVAVLEKSYIGSGAAGRNTTIIRSNYRTPEGAAFYKRSVELYERLGADLDFNLLFSQSGHLTLAHSERSLVTMTERAEVNQLLGIDSRLIGNDEIAKLCPELDL